MTVSSGKEGQTNFLAKIDFTQFAQGKIGPLDFAKIEGYSSVESPMYRNIIILKFNVEYLVICNNDYTLEQESSN